MAPGSDTEVSVSSLPCRKPCLLLNNLLAIIGAVLMLFSQTAMSFEMIMVGRFLYGINSGEPTVWRNPLHVSFSWITSLMAAPSLFAPHLTLQTINFYLYLSRVYFFSSLPFVTPVIDHYWRLSKCIIPFCAPLGVSLSVHPIYIIECTPKRLRLMVGVTVASCMSFGKFSGQLLGIRWGGRRHGYCAESNWGVRWWSGLNYSWHVDRSVPWCPLCRGCTKYEILTYITCHPQTKVDPFQIGK